jgi:hypothetical protein
MVGDGVVFVWFDVDRRPHRRFDQFVEKLPLSDDVTMPRSASASLREAIVRLFHIGTGSQASPLLVAAGSLPPRRARRCDVAWPCSADDHRAWPVRLFDASVMSRS